MYTKYLVHHMDSIIALVICKVESSSKEFMSPCNSDNPSDKEITDKIIAANFLSNKSLGMERRKEKQFS